MVTTTGLELAGRIQLGNSIKKNSFTRLKDPVSCLTHLGAGIAALVFSPVLLIHAMSRGVGIQDMIALVIFLSSMILLYAASASYHGFRASGVTAIRLKRFDHMMISVLIAGTYTPICVCAMGEKGRPLLILIWFLAAAGMLFKLLWVTCPKWISSVPS